MFWWSFVLFVAVVCGYIVFSFYMLLELFKPDATAGPTPEMPVVITWLAAGAAQILALFMVVARHLFPPSGPVPAAPSDNIETAGGDAA